MTLILISFILIGAAWLMLMSITKLEKHKKQNKTDKTLEMSQKLNCEK